MRNDEEDNNKTESKQVTKNIIENIEDLLDKPESNTFSRPEPEPEPEPEPSFIDDRFDENSIVKKPEKELISVEKI